jgi:curli biogenesis system outer membrane secretion channel CsgG
MSTSTIRFLVIAFAAPLLSVSLNACTTTTGGEVKDDTTLTGETRRLSEAGAAYAGPDYVVGILTFENRTPSKVLGIGEAATTILRTQFVQAGLQVILLEKSEIATQQNLISLEKSGIVKAGEKRANEGFDAIDFRLSGAITAYSEVDEGVDAVLYQRKTRVAKVTVDYALVDVETGKTLVAESGAGIYKKTTTGSLGLGASSSFDPGLRDEALRDALAKALNKMVARLGSEPFRGKVLLSEGKSVMIRAGTRSRISENSELGVFRPGRELRDPDSGKVLGRQETQVGVIRVIRHQNERVSEASVVSGEGFKPGDVVKAVR